jgi:repressor LexA
MKQLHVSQEKLLSLLRDNIESPLTMRELQDELGLASPSVVHHHIQQLEKKGYLKRNPNNTKDYVVMGDPEKSIVYINKYGLAQCGPKGSILDGNPIDKIPIASRLIKFPTDEAFIVEAKGDSMEPTIKQGDIIIAKKQNYAENNDLVVCVHESEVLIKKYILSGKNVILYSLNKNYDPFLSNKVRIEGVVKNVLQYS